MVRLVAILATLYIVGATIASIVAWDPWPVIAVAVAVAILIKVALAFKDPPPPEVATAPGPKTSGRSRKWEKS